MRRAPWRDVPGLDRVSPTLTSINALEASIPKVAQTLEASALPPTEATLETELLRELNLELPTAAAVKQYRLGLDGWPGVGPADIAIPLPESPPLLLELKWGKGTLYNCAWDALKLATALAVGATEKAFMLAGAPAGEWASGAEGAELFGKDAVDWDVQEFIARHASGFAEWRRAVQTRPRRVPDNFSTDTYGPDGVWTLTVEGEPWELRCAELALTLTSGWIELDEEGQTSRSHDGPAPLMQWERPPRRPDL